MSVMRSMPHAIFAFALLTGAAAAQTTAQEPVKKTGKLICGSFSARQKESHPWNEAVAVEIDRGVITVTRPDYPPPKGTAFKGILAPSGAILIAGEGNFEEGQAAWNYEFSGKLNAAGTTDLKGRLQATKGVTGYRVCSMSF
jgi:hypothetical protein